MDFTLSEGLSVDRAVLARWPTKVADYFPPRRRCIVPWIHTFGFAGRIAPANGVAMHDLAMNRMSMELHSAGL